MTAFLYYIDNVTVTDAILTATNLADDDDWPAYNAGTTYGLGAIVSDATTHQHYKSLQAANTGNALTDDAWWVAQNYTNKFRAFDRFIADQATHADEITMTLRPGRYFDALAFYNLSASSLSVVVTSDSAGEVYNETFDLLNSDGIFDWYPYFFSPIEQLTEKVVSDIPPYADAEISITITNTGGTAKLGQLDIGQKSFLGRALTGTEPSFQDFSYKEQDDFGRWTVTQRAYSNNVRYRVAADKSTINNVRQRIANRRALPTTFFSPNTEQQGTLVFGFPKEFAAPLQFGATFFPLEIEGLT